jgi:hypothetical protein
VGEHRERGTKRGERDREGDAQQGIQRGRDAADGEKVIKRERQKGREEGLTGDKGGETEGGMKEGDI